MYWYNQGSPNISSIGLNIRPISFINDIETLNTAAKLSTTPTTPTIIPSLLPTQSPLIDQASWDIPAVVDTTVQSIVENTHIESSSTTSTSETPIVNQEFIEASSRINSPLITQEVIDRATERLVASTSSVVNEDIIQLSDTFIND